MKWLIWGILGLLVLPVLVIGGWTYGALQFSYSSGERSGYVQKISNKGWVCKTWEGELAMVTQPGVPPQLFAFSVRDETVARSLLDAAGKRVNLTYEQHKGLPGNCFGETEYFITGSKIVQEQK